MDKSPYLKIFISVAVVTILITIVVKYAKPSETYVKCPVLTTNRTLKYIQPFVEKRVYNDSPQKIPRIIVQTNEYENVPTDMYNSIQTIINDNPDYDYMYYDNISMRMFLVENYSDKVIDAFDKLIPGAYKADLFRYCFLYKFGGVYIDTGMISVKGLHYMIDPLDTFISAEDNGTGGIYNAFMASTPNHPIIGTAIEMTITNIQNNFYGKNALDITGPSLLARAFESALFNGVKVSIQPNKSYGNGIKLIKFKKTDDCTGSGMLSVSSVASVNVLQTKYPTYYIDAKWYNTNEHYSKLWNSRRVYRYFFSL